MISEDPWLRMAIPSTNDYRRTDLDIGDVNADGRPDVMLVYGSWDEDADRIVLLLSHRG